MRLVHVLKAASEGYGPEKRVILLHGPVGSSKSTIARLLKQGIENYSRTREGALYSFDWINLEGTGLAERGRVERLRQPDERGPAPPHPAEWRQKTTDDIGLSNEQYRVRVEGELDPASRFIYKHLIVKYDGNWAKMIEKHVRCRRLVLSEKDRIGIGTFQPKDEKNQDSTELTGDINYRKIAEYGSDSDRARSTSTASSTSPTAASSSSSRCSSSTSRSSTIFSARRRSTRSSRRSSRRPTSTRSSSATRTSRVQEAPEQRVHGSLAGPHDQDRHPYITKLTEEIRIYEKDFSDRKIKNKHIAPHTLEVAAMWAVMTRLETRRSTTCPCFRR